MYHKKANTITEWVKIFLLSTLLFMLCWDAEPHSYTVNLILLVNFVKYFPLFRAYVLYDVCQIIFANSFNVSNNYINVLILSSFSKCTKNCVCAMSLKHFISFSHLVFGEIFFACDPQWVFIAKIYSFGGFCNILCL